MPTGRYRSKNTSATVFMVPGGYGTIQAAINAASAAAPTAASPALVLVSPGTYTENITLKPFVFVASIDSALGTTQNGAFSSIISGTVTYTAPADSNSYNININGLIWAGALTLDASAKTGGNDSIIVQNCFNNNAAMTIKSRAALPTDDVFRFINCRLRGPTFTDAQCILTACTGAGTYTLAGASALTVQAASALPAVTMSGTSTLTQDSGTIGNLTANTGTSADIRGVAQQGTLAFAGTGAINRSVINGTTGALAAGAGQVITFAVPLKDATYKVQLTPTAVANLPILVTAVAAASFTVTVPAGGGTWDYTVIHN